MKGRNAGLLSSVHVRFVVKYMSEYSLVDFFSLILFLKKILGYQIDFILTSNFLMTRVTGRLVSVGSVYFLIEPIITGGGIFRVLVK